MGETEAAERAIQQRSFEEKIADLETCSNLFQLYEFQLSTLKKENNNQTTIPKEFFQKEKIKKKKSTIKSLLNQV